jgi:hypothetical protein
MEKLVRLTLRRCINKQSFTAVTTAVLLVLCGCSPRRDPAENELRKVRAGKLRDDIAGALAGGRQTELGYVTLDVLAANSDKLPKSLEGSAVVLREPSGRLISVKEITAERMRDVLLDGAIMAIDVHRPDIVKPQITLTSPVTPGRGTTALRAITVSIPRRQGLPTFLQEHPGVDGSGVVAAVVDVGPVAGTHQEFGVSGSPPPPSRVVIKEPGAFVDHSTGVAGLIGAFGAFPQARGMATNAAILSYKMDRPINALTDAIQRSARVSNHSYGPPAGWEWQGNRWVWFGDENASEDAWFGKYGVNQANLDALLWNSQLLAFAAAGNDRSGINEGPSSVPCTGGSGQCCPHVVRISDTQFVNSNRCRPRDGGQTQGDTLSGPCLAKNTVCMTVADPVTQAVAGPWSLGDGGFGPADDLRIKPDLTAEGNLLQAPGASQPYVRISGTSAASAVGAGAGVLLIDLFQRTRQRLPSVAEIKAVLIHTAVAPTNEPRVPNIKFGWGILDLVGAGRVIARTTEHVILSGAISAGVTVSKSLRATQPHVRATLVWIDPAGVPNNEGIDDLTSSLVNDLDMIVTGNSVFHPYRLTADVSRPATDGPNRVDPVERIDLDASVGSLLTLNIQGFRVTGTQHYAIVISGAKITP